MLALTFTCGPVLQYRVLKFCHRKLFADSRHLQTSPGPREFFFGEEQTVFSFDGLRSIILISWLFALLKVLLTPRCSCFNRIQRKTRAAIQVPHVKPLGPMPWWVGGRGTLGVTGDGSDLLIREPYTLSS